MPRLAVLGYPVGHSRSPAMQNAALEALGLGDDWRYEAIEVAPEEFESQVRAMAGVAGESFAGANVTVPHKIMAFSLADTASKMAAEIGAANTLSFDANGIHADNTDAEGLIASLPESPKGRSALVLGAGGAARAAVWALGREGASVDLWNRTITRAESFQIELGELAQEHELEITVNVVEMEIEEHSASESEQGAYELIVNTTAVGLQGEDPFLHLPLLPDAFGPGQVVVDMVYGDSPSTLLAAAEDAGATTVDGIEVLVQQGALSFEIWTGRKPPLDVMRAAARGDLRR